MAQADEDDERETVIFHGTALDVAERIVAQKKFERQETHFASLRTLAAHFALRSVGKRSRVQSPAIIRAALYESDLKAWIRNRCVVSKGLDEGDDPALRGQTQ